MIYGKRLSFSIKDSLCCMRSDFMTYAKVIKIKRRKRFGGAGRRKYICRETNALQRIRMERLSLYEFLSFVMPGVVVVEVSRHFLTYLPVSTLMAWHEQSSGWVGGLVYFLLVLGLGCLVHVLTFKCISSLKWYKTLVYPQMQDLKFYGIVKAAIPFLNEHYAKAHKAKMKQPKTPMTPAKNLFDFAYYYLEAKGKIAQAKNFQGLYFLFRNLVTLAILGVGISVTGGVLLLCLYPKESLLTDVVVLLVGSLLVMGVCTYMARWFRQKMADRVLGTYYAEIVHQTQ